MGSSQTDMMGLKQEILVKYIYQLWLKNHDLQTHLVGCQKRVACIKLRSSEVVKRDSSMGQIDNLNQKLAILQFLYLQIKNHKKCSHLEKILKQSTKGESGMYSSIYPWIKCEVQFFHPVISNHHTLPGFPILNR